nr:phosphatase PAP2 family protein [uncultured Pseudomonas sp.]
MDYPALFQPKWNAKKFLLCNLVALALLLVWIWPTGHAAFTQFDEWFFHLLNRPLEQNKVWLWIWTIASMRPFDIVVGLILLMLLIKGDWVFKAVQTRAALIGFVLTLILLLIIRTVFSKIIDHSSLQHDSASMVIPDAIKLSEIFPTLEDKWQLKDRSSQSFPGDHASVLLIWAMFMTVSSRSVGQRVIIWALALLFMMPRLVAGAHWGQDDYIGGVMIALLALGWSCYTPFVAVVTGWLLRATAPLFNLFGRFALLRCLSIMKPGAHL